MRPRLKRVQGSLDVADTATPYLFKVIISILDSTRPYIISLLNSSFPLSSNHWTLVARHSGSFAVLESHSLYSRRHSTNCIPHKPWHKSLAFQERLPSCVPVLMPHGGMIVYICPQGEINVLLAAFQLSLFYSTLNTYPTCRCQPRGFGTREGPLE
jgi:hypothetical protein